MKEILNLNDTWILQEIALLSSDAPSPPPPPRRDASHVYWLVRPLDDENSPLAVYQEFPVDAGKQSQVFCLSFCGSDDLSETTRLPTIQPGESPDIGTRLLWQDDRVKIWEFRLAVGERCPFHRHVRPYCFVNLTESRTHAWQGPGEAEEGVLNHQTAGQCTYVSRQDLSAHAVRNVGPGVFLQFIVEFMVQGDRMGGGVPSGTD